MIGGLINRDNSEVLGNGIEDMAIDNDGVIWMGIGTRLQSFDGTSWTHYHPGSNNSIISSVAIDGDNNKWVGTRGGGLKKLGPGETIPIVYDEDTTGLPTDLIYCVAVDDNGTVWCGLGDILASFDGTVWDTFYLPGTDPMDPFPNIRVNTLAIDEDGVKWCGTDEGLMRYDGSWTVWDENNSALPNDWIFTIAIDENDVKWIGTREGITSFNGVGFTTYDQSNSGLPHNTVLEITIDDNGTKWIGTKHGLAAFGECTTPFDISITDNSPVLVANPSGMTYQWLDCTNSCTPIAGATAQSFTVTSNGVYAVDVTDGACTYTSECVEVVVNGLLDDRYENGSRVYPNPTTGKLVIENFTTGWVRILNSLGVVLMEKTLLGPGQELDVSGLPNGVFFLQMQNDVGGYWSIKKVIKQ